MTCYCDNKVECPIHREQREKQNALKAKSKLPWFREHAEWYAPKPPPVASNVATSYREDSW